MTQTNEIDASEQPIQVELDGSEFTIRRIEPEDANALLSYAKPLPRHDIVYMRRNLSTQAGIDKWFRALDSGNTPIHCIVTGKYCWSTSCIHPRRLTINPYLSSHHHLC